MMLNDAELERYARHLVLKEIGGAGQARLKAAHVTVVGAGGIGAPVLLYLAAAGVGRLTIIDDDAVSLSNLQRQVIFADGDVGRSKAEEAAARVRALNPGVAVTVHAARITATNAAQLLVGADVVIDGTDNFATRLMVSDAAHAMRTPLVSAAIGQFHGQIATWRGYDPALPCYRCFVGDAHDADDCDTCAELGVLGAMTGIMGSFAALEVIRALHPFGDNPAGKLHIFDGLAPAMRTIRVPKDPACKTCGSSSTR
jgi:molybdopterin-synthase adenylyltransferase